MKRNLSLGSIVVGIMLLALVASPVFGGSENGQQGLERAIAAQEKHTNNLLAKEGIAGTAVGLNPSGKMAVLVLTAKGGVGNIPDELDGVPVAVRVTGEFVALVGPPAPVASFSVSCNGLSCDFDASSSKGRKLSFAWDFETDGNIVNTTGSQVSNVYNVADEYTVVLRITDGKDNRTSKTDRTFTVPDEGDPAPPPPDPDPAPIYPKGKFKRPVPIGVSTGNANLVTIGADQFCTVGTIGARLTEAVTDGPNVDALSNNHVYAQENQASSGSDVLQLGRVDMTGPWGSGDEIGAAGIGTLASFVPIKFDGTDNRVDAAIALSSIEQLGNATPSDGYGTPNSTTVPVTELFSRQTVLKYGRATGLTSGKLDAINATVNVSYDSGTARFVGQIIVKGKHFLASGDSESLLVSESNGPIGLLFAGSDSGPGFAMANPIDEVLSELEDVSNLGELSIDGNP